MLGITLSLLAAVGFGTSSLMARVGLQRISSAAGTLISLVSSIVIAIAASLIFQFHYVVTLSLTAVLWFALVGLFNFGLGRYLNFEGLKHIGAARATVLFSTSQDWPTASSTLPGSINILAADGVRPRLSTMTLSGCLRAVPPMTPHLAVSRGSSASTVFIPAIIASEI